MLLNLLSNPWFNFTMYFVVFPATILLVVIFVRQNLCRSIRRSELRYKSVVENATEGIVQTTRDGIFLAVNPAFASMLGYDSPEEVMKLTYDIDKQIYVRSEVRQDFLARLERDGVAKCEYQARKKDGSTVWLLASSRKIENEKGKFVYYISIVEDISERKLKEARLQSLADSLAQSNSELESFAHMVAHDLTEPLRTMVAFNKLLVDDYRAKLAPESLTCLDFIEGAARRMTSFVADILNFSKANSIPSRLENIDLKEIVESAKKDFQIAIGEAQASIDIKDLPVVRGDRTKLLRLFANLLSNSLKFRRLDEQLKISISAISRGSQWMISFSDNGVGFEKEDTTNVFRLFTRLKNANNIFGSGMGLAACKRIVEIHGGKIWADSIPGQGSVFYFLLPVAVEDSVPAESPISQSFS